MRRNILIISAILFIFQPSYLLAQDSLIIHAIDSLKQIIKTSKQDTAIISAYFKWGELIDIENPDSAIILYNNATDIAEKTLQSMKNFEALTYNEKFIYYTIKKYLAESLNDIACYYDFKGDISGALKYHFKSLKIQKEISNKEGIANSLNNIGYVYNNQGNISKALDYYHNSLIIQIEINDSLRSAATLNNIGYIYYNQGDTSKALEYYFKSLKIQEELNKNPRITTYDAKEGIAYSLSNIGKICYAQGNIAKALEYLLRSLKIRKEIDDVQGIGYSLNDIGKIYEDLNDISTALDYYQKSLKIQEETGNKRGVSNCLVNIGNLKLKINEVIQAKTMAQIAFKLASDLNFPENIEGSAGLLKKVFEKQGNFQQAYYYYKIEIKMRDTIANKENFKKTQKLQAKYEYQKKATVDSIAFNKAIEIKNLELSRSEKIKEKQLVVIYSFLLGLIIVVSFSFLLYRQYNAKKKANIMLAHKNIDIQHKNEEITFQHQEIQKQNSIIENKNANITASITYAKRIQSAILPPTELIEQLIPDSFILYKPKSIVSGDFYWLDKRDQYIYIAAVDCTGHGVPGAFMSIVGYNILNQALNEKQLTIPADIINYLSVSVAKTLRQSDDEKSVRDGMDLILCRIDKTDFSLEFAGSHIPLIIIRNGKIIEFKTEVFSIGQAFSNKFKGFSNQDFKLEKNDMLYLFSDGYIDQFSADTDRKFSTVRFKELLTRISPLPRNEQRTELDLLFEQWKGNSDQIDDMMVIGIRI